MTSENPNGPATSSNEDLQFERSNVSTTDTQQNNDNEILSDTPAVDESKVEELASNDVQPLSEAEKKPKLEEDQRIEEMNRKTSIGD